MYLVGQVNRRKHMRREVTQKRHTYGIGGCNHVNDDDDDDDAKCGGTRPAKVRHEAKGSGTRPDGTKVNMGSTIRGR